MREATRLAQAETEYSRKGFPRTLEGLYPQLGKYELLEKVCVLIDNLKTFHGLTQKEIADFLGVYRRNLWLWERSTPDGRISIPEPEHQRRLLFLDKYLSAVGSPAYKLVEGIKRPGFAKVIWSMLLRQDYDDVLLLTDELLERSEEGCGVETKSIVRLYRAIAFRNKLELSKADNILLETAAICTNHNIISAVVSSERGGVAFKEGLQYEGNNPELAAQSFQRARNHINDAIKSYPNEPEFFYNRLNTESKLRNEGGCIDSVEQFIRVATPTMGVRQAKQFLLRRVNNDRDLIFVQRLEEIESLMTELGFKSKVV